MKPRIIDGCFAGRWSISAKIKLPYATGFVHGIFPLGFYIRLENMEICFGSNLGRLWDVIKDTSKRMTHRFAAMHPLLLTPRILPPFERSQLFSRPGRTTRRLTFSLTMNCTIKTTQTVKGVLETCLECFQEPFPAFLVLGIPSWTTTLLHNRKSLWLRVGLGPCVVSRSSVEKNETRRIFIVATDG